MATDPAPALPGNLTVPPLAGWEDLLTAVLLVVAVAVAFVVVLAAGAAVSGRSEWQAWLDARSRRSPQPSPWRTPGPGLRSSHPGDAEHPLHRPRRSSSRPA
ncbi:hypothetical protein [Blastococcus montanus]|uniref:hypothetical protein n=1 Tax=Blastococcus montanus TaxID=3144973 RepID=UPI0032090FB7